MEMTPYRIRDAGIAWLAIWLLTTLLPLLIGCGHSPVHPAPPSPVPVIRPWTLESYQQFLADNQRMMDRIYGNDYIETRFIVDTAQGAMAVQQLIDPDAVRPLAEAHLPQHGSDRQIIDAADHYVTSVTRYDADPSVWPTISETLNGGRADCKGRSLLLLSLLLAAQRKAYAAIGNGHMWVVVMVDGQWQRVETDKDPQRRQIYKMPGFYDRPLYRIDANRTLKRKRISMR